MAVAAPSNRWILACTVALLLAASAPACVPSESPPAAQPVEAGLALPGVSEAGGASGAGILSLVEKSFDFGPVDCGAAAPPKTFTVKNVGQSKVTYNATVKSGPFSLEGDVAGSADPGEERTVTLKANTVPAGATPGLAVTGVVAVTSDVPGAPELSLPITLTPRGAVVTVQPAPADFGQVKVGATAPVLPIVLANTGNAPVTVSLAPGALGDFSLVGADAPIVLAGGASQTLDGNFAPKASGAVTKAVALSAQGAICGAPPAAVELKGEGTYAPVTVTGTLNFGTTDCGTQATAKTVTIKNDNAFAITFAATLPVGSIYSVTPKNGSVAANGEVALTVSSPTMTAPRSVAPNAYGSSLTVTTNAPNDPNPHVLSISQSARGAIIGASMVVTDFGSSTRGVAKSLALNLTNTGNVAASVGLSTSAPFSTSLGAGTASLVATTGTASPNVIFTPTAGVVSNGTVTLSSTGVPLCAALPSAIAIKGTGLLPKYVYGGNGLGALGVTCGVLGAPTATVVIANDVTATGALVLSNIAVTGPATVSPTSATPIAPGGSVTFTVTGKNAVVGTDLGGSAPTVTLSFNTNDPLKATASIAGTRPVTGANLSYVRFDQVGVVPITSLDINGCPFVTNPQDYFALSNSGNADGFVNIPAIAGAYSFYVDATNPISVFAGGTSQSVQVMYTGPVGATTAAVPTTVATVPVGGGNICKMVAPLPLRYVALPASAPQCM